MDNHRGTVHFEIESGLGATGINHRPLRLQIVRPKKGESMKRILFVDDEPLVLQGLQRVLRSMSGNWKMEFILIF